jgi:hypothetical protein
MGLRDYAARGFAAGLAVHGIETARAFVVEPAQGRPPGLGHFVFTPATAAICPRGASQCVQYRTDRAPRYGQPRPPWMTRRRAVQRFVGQKGLRNYRELLAQERAETERLFIAAVLARKEAKNRRRASRGWVVKPALVPIFKNLGDLFLASEPARQGESR